MAIIRFSDEEVFGVDSSEYEILAHAAASVGNDVKGAVVEIGSRRGGSAKIIIDALASKGNTDRSMFCIDPYGHIDIDCTNLSVTIHNPERTVEGDKMSKDISSKQKFDHDNTMRNRTIPSLYYYGYNAGLNFNFFCLEDTEFFARYVDGVPVYNENKTMLNDYAFVFFDGPHTNEAVIDEINFFASRSPVGAVWVFDDVWMYDHEMIEDKYIFPNGFEVLQKGDVKISYIKIM